ncbi:Ubiquitin fusion degradation protein 4, partial [Ascosphaera atra]
MLADLRRDDDPSLQLIALQELSDYLLVSNEDNLAGHFSPDAFVTELVKLMQPNPVTGEENPEIMLLACRSLANMMEALRGSIANVVYGGAVPVLCQKLLDIQFIDLAEQALDTLHKISGDFPGSIVKEGGLTACLTYLDFFPTSTQRTAVTTAANSCRNLSSHSFPVVKDVMPILLNVLKSNDQRVVEQGCTCVSRIVESFKRRPAKLEELIQPEMLKTVLGLLVPGTTNLIGPHVHTQLLRVVAHSARCSARLSGELLRMGVVDTLYQILTGVSPPAMDEDEESVSVSEGAGSSGVKNDSVRIMQSLIHLPQEQVYQALNVIVEALPPIPDDRFQPGNTAAAERVFNIDEIANLLPHRHHHSHHRHHHHHHTKTPAQEIKERVDMLSSLPQPAVRRFAKILFPTLTDTYASTVNQSVREKVLIAQMKMLLYLDPTTLESALKEVPYASFLASIFTQAQGMLYDGEADKLAAGPAGLAGQASLSGAPLAAVSASGYLVPVGYALQCAILLFERLPGVYLYQFQREGVVAQVERIARWEMRGERELRAEAGKEREGEKKGDDKEKGVEQGDENVRADESKDKDVRMDDPVSEAEDNAEARED